MKFVPRLTKPEAGNKYYIRIASGGWSPCIEGSPKDPDCDVLSNCVGYVCGRFAELCGRGAVDLLNQQNGENVLDVNKRKFKTGDKPKLGAVMCWAKGQAHNAADGYGHVAIVEQVISDTEVITSESAYGGKAFFTKNRKKGADGKWGTGAGYTFQGFIYPPVTFEAEKPAAETGKPTAEQTASDKKKKTETRTLAFFANLRDKPSPNSARLAGLPVGTAVEVETNSETVFKGVDGKDYVYVKAVWKGRSGWLVKSALKL